MKVLHLIQRYPPAVGGSETWCREVCQELAAAGDEVKVLTMDVIDEEEFWRDPLVERCTLRLGRLDWDHRVLVRRFRRSLPIYNLYHGLLKTVLDRWLRTYFYGPHSLEMCGRLLAEVRTADVVHLHTIPYPHNYFGYLAARLRGKRVVITPYFHPGHPDYERWSHYWLLKRCDAVIAISEYERDYLAGKGVDATKIVTTGGGVHPEEYRLADTADLASFRRELLRTHGLPERARAVLFVGRKQEYKGIATLVDAFKRLPRHLDAALFLVGPSTPWFDDFYRGLPTQDRASIIDLGVLPHADKVHLLHLADVLVLPSRFESFGIVFLEAWACGTPVIATDIGAMPGVVADGGFVFESENSAQLADRLQRLLEDAPLTQRLARRGHERLLEYYTWDKIATATRAAYRPPRPRARPRRVLICSNVFPPHSLGGAEIVAHQEALVLKELGVDVEIFCGRLDPDARHVPQAIAENGEPRRTVVPLRPTDLSGEWWNFRDHTIHQRFAAILDRFAPDVVHFHNLVGLSVTMIDECQARCIPTVLTLHDYWGICFKNTMLKNEGSLCSKGGFDCLECKTTLIGESSIASPVRNSHVLLSLAKVDRFIAPSQYLANQYAANGIPRERISVIRYGVDLDRFAATRRDGGPFTVGFIGYLGKHKGVDWLLRALSLLPDVDNLRVLVIGDGEERGTLEALCRELRLDGCVTFCGRIDHHSIAGIHAQLDVLAIPSVWSENSPVTIYEAMASGTPVVAFDVGGIGELVEHGVTGLLAPPRDPQTLAHLIERLRRDPDLRRTIVKNAVARIRQEELRGQVTRLLQVFEDVTPRAGAMCPPGFDIVLYSSALYWHRGVREMLRQLARVERKLHRRLLICRMDLCDPDTLQAAKLLLLPTPGGDALRHGRQALQWEIPLVVTDTASDLQQLCRQSSAGLIYADADELADCLELLLTDERLAKTMGANGHAFIDAEPAAIG